MYRLLPGAAALVLGLAFWTFTIDDAGIALRYARNLAAGAGPVFSTDGSPPVEGYSNPLWVLLEAPLFRVGLSDEAALRAAKTLGFVFVLATVALAGRLARQLGAGRTGAILAATFVALVPYVAFWGVSGLETSLYLFLLLASLTAYTAAQTSSAGLRMTGVLLLALALTRPEGIVTAAAVLASGPVAASMTRSPIDARRALRRMLPAFLIVGLGYLLWTAWRWSYYGAPLSNTFFAKAVLPGRRQLMARGVETLPLAVYLVPLVWPAWRAAVARLGHPAMRGVLAACLAQGVFLVLPSPEWRPAFRYELPVVVLVALLAGIGVGHAIDATRADSRVRRLAWAGTLVAVLWLVMPAWSLRPWTSTSPAWTELALARWLRTYAPDASLATYDTGIVPYFSRLPRIVDIGAQGLLNPRIARHGYDIETILGDRPDIVLLPPPEDLTLESDPIARLSSHERFRTSFTPVATLTIVDDYRLRVYVREGYTFGAGASAAVDALAEASRQNPPTSRADRRLGFFSGTLSPR